ncbi:MAG TPA: hypothetical protein VGE01_11135 [Fimbriimonas sp.]
MRNRTALIGSLAALAVLLVLLFLFVRPYVTIISNFSYGEDESDPR